MSKRKRPVEFPGLIPQRQQQQQQQQQNNVFWMRFDVTL